jgi:hypothetical protein
LNGGFQQIELAARFAAVVIDSKSTIRLHRWPFKQQLSLVTCSFGGRFV